jgi:tetraacyldisaccharide-1-P 4'-kinase
LREWPEAAKYADAILITKAPLDLSEKEAQEHIKAIQRLQKPVFFFHYSNTEPLNFWGEKDFEPNEPVFVYSGIAQGIDWAPITWDLAGAWNRKDHAPLGPSEWEELVKRVMKSGARQLVMTRKDAMKLPNSRPQNLPFDLYVVHNEAQILFGQTEALKSLISGG